MYNKYYVGSSENVQQRIQQHFDGNGSSWTKKYKPVEIIDVVSNCDKFDEDKYTKQYMSKYGIDNVRGGTYCENNIDKYKEFLEKELKHSNGKCFKCGSIYHYAKDCEESDKEIWECEYCDEEFETEKEAEKHIECSHTYVCYRCGREGHYANSCYARRHINGNYI